MPMNPATAPSTYLLPHEIEQLTGRRYAAHQAKVLAAQQWVFTVDGDGRPLILRAYHDQRLGLKPAPQRRGPRLEGLAAAAR